MGKRTCSCVFITLLATTQCVLLIPRLISAETAAGCSNVGLQINMTTADSSGNLTSPDYPNWFLKNSTCAWVFHCPVGRLIKIHFEDFTFSTSKSSENLEYLEVRDGPTSKSALIKTYSSESSPLKDTGPVVYSSGSDMYILLKTDPKKETLKGRFKIMYSSTKPGHSCSPFNTDDENNNIIITPPASFSLGEAGLSNASVSCTWKIHGSLNKSVKLVLNASNEHHVCSGYDAFIFDGRYGSASGKALLNLCERRTKHLLSGHAMYSPMWDLSFQLKTSNLSTLRLLKGNITLVEKSQSGACNQDSITNVIDITSEGGTIINPHYPDKHPNKSCIWKISTAKNMRIKVTILDLHMYCSSAYLEFHDGNSSKANYFGDGKYCGTNFVYKETLITSGAQLWLRYTITFQMATSILKRFILSYESTYEEQEKPVCYPDKDVIRSYHKEMAGFVYTPKHFKGFIPINTHCRWTLAAPIQRHLKLMLTVNLPPTNTCENSLEVYEEIKAVPPFNSTKLRAKFCGFSKELKPVVHIHSPALTVVVKSQSSKYYKGVFCVYESYSYQDRSKMSFCSQYNEPEYNADIIVTKESGKISSPNDYGRPYPPGMLCKWTFKPDNLSENDRLKIIFGSKFDFPFRIGQKCMDDHVEIDYGNGTVQRYCGSSAPPDFSSGNIKSFSITFVSTALYKSNVGFSARYKIIKGSSVHLSWAIIAVIIIAGVLLLLLAAFCVYRFKKKKRFELDMARHNAEEELPMDTVPTERAPLTEGSLYSAPLGPPPPYSEGPENIPHA